MDNGVYRICLSDDCRHPNPVEEKKIHKNVIACNHTVHEYSKIYNILIEDLLINYSWTFKLFPIFIIIMLIYTININL